MKIDPKHLLIGTVVLILIILGVAYKFGYAPKVEQAEKVENETKSLTARKDELNAKIANKPMYQEGIETSKKIIDSVFKKYGPGNTPEKTIMMIVDLCNKIGVKISNITFNQDSPIYTSSATKEDGTPMYILNKSSSNISVTGGYTEMKKFMDYINCYKERMNVENFNWAYSLDTGIITSSVSLNLYSVNDDNHTYVAPVIEDIELGKTNIFRNFSVAFDAEGNPIDITEENYNLLQPEGGDSETGDTTED